MNKNLAFSIEFMRGTQMGCLISVMVIALFAVFVPQHAKILVGIGFACIGLYCLTAIFESLLCKGDRPGA